EQVVELGNQVVIVPYGLSGSADLHANIAAHLDNQCNAYIMQNHGVLCLGVDMAQAARNAEILEKCARVYYYALATGEEITTIDEEFQAILFEMLKSKQQETGGRKQEAGGRRQEAG
ncbi:MAG: class II aldolase/adducin family protein, partial [Chloroflexota bacterium]|nr:class II aldolase/adducin family protein [Chloroflexota bacterium]